MPIVATMLRSLAVAASGAGRAPAPSAIPARRLASTGAYGARLVALRQQLAVDDVDGDSSIGAFLPAADATARSAAPFSTFGAVETVAAPPPPRHRHPLRRRRAGRWQAALPHRPRQ